MLIYLNIEEKIKIIFSIYVNFTLIYVNIADGRTNRQTHQKNSSEPKFDLLMVAKNLSKFFVF